jgi:hypothetical protein
MDKEWDLKAHILILVEQEAISAIPRVWWWGGIGVGRWSESLGPHLKA